MTYIPRGPPDVAPCRRCAFSPSPSPSRRPLRSGQETAILTTLTLLIVALYAAALCGWLAAAAETICATGLLLAVPILAVGRRRASSVSGTRMIWFALLIFLLAGFYWWNSDFALYAWDDIGHWAVKTRFIATQDRLFDAASPVILQQYPPASALFHYFFLKIGGYSEPHVIFAQFVLSLGCIVAVLGPVAERSGIVAATGLGLLLLGLNLILFDFSNIAVDGLLGLLLGAALVIALTERTTKGVIVANIPILTALTLVKTSGFLFALIGAAVTLTLIWVRPQVDGEEHLSSPFALRRGSRAGMALGAAAMPLAIGAAPLSWQRYGPVDWRTRDVRLRDRRPDDTRPRCAFFSDAPSIGPHLMAVRKTVLAWPGKSASRLSRFAADGLESRAVASCRQTGPSGTALGLLVDVARLRCLSVASRARLSDLLRRRRGRRIGRFRPLSRELFCGLGMPGSQRQRVGSAPVGPARNHASGLRYRCGRGRRDIARCFCPSRHNHRSAGTKGQSSFDAARLRSARAPGAAGCGTFRPDLFREARRRRLRPLRLPIRHRSAPDERSLLVVGKALPGRRHLDMRCGFGRADQGLFGLGHRARRRSIRTRFGQYFDAADRNTTSGVFRIRQEGARPHLERVRD